MVVSTYELRYTNHSNNYNNQCYDEEWMRPGGSSIPYLSFLTSDVVAHPIDLSKKSV